MIQELRKSLSEIKLVQQEQNAYIKTLERKLKIHEERIRDDQKKIADLEELILNKNEPLNQAEFPFQQEKSHGRQASKGVLNGTDKGWDTNSVINKRDVHFNLSRKKRLLSVPEPQNGVAFSAYMSANEGTVGAGHTLIFHSLVTNVGNHYNKHTGVFTSPDSGVYVFTWTIIVDNHDYIRTELVVNSSTVGTMYTSAYDVNNDRTTTGVVVVQINQGDVVFIRTNHTSGSVGTIISIPDVLRSTFSGWKLF
ncbi:cerebellin-1-like [Saccostrea cucullata]|uniref:cerebellin-1-like n=1 Tax=Saccostrea cuccullata TaxID=36930 RepID=UPI002ED65829